MYAAEHTRTGSAAMARIASRNPMEVLARLTEEFPNAGTELLFVKWRDEIKDDDDLLSAALHHAFTNMFTAIERLKDNRRTDHGSIRERQRQQQKEQTNSAAEEIIKTVKKVILMSLILPNGKALRYCTFAECAVAGGWFSKVAKLGKPNQIVGQVATEEQLAKIKV